MKNRITQKYTFALVAWFVCCLFYFYQCAIQVFPNVMISELMLTYSANTFQIGVLASAYFISYALLQVYIGSVLDQNGLRSVLLFSLISYLFFIILFIMVKNYYVATLLRLLMGAVGIAAFIGAVRFATIYLKGKNTGLFIGLTESLGYLGSMSATLLGAWFLEVYSWQIVLGASVLFGLLILLGFILMIPEHHIEKEYVPIEEKKKFYVFKAIKYFFSNKEILHLSIWCGLIGSPILGFGGLWGSDFFQHVFNVSPLLGKKINAIIFLGVALGCPLLGSLAHYYNSEVVKRVSSLVSVIVVLLYFLLPEHTPVTILFILQFILGVSSGAFVIPFSEISALSTHMRSTILGLANAVSLLGVFIIQPFFGYIVGKNYQYFLPFISTDGYAYRLGLLLVLGLTLLSLLMLFRHRKIDSPDKT